MKVIALIVFNVSLLGLFIYLFSWPHLLTYHQDRRLWLTWLSVGVITLMDGCTSPFFGIAEASELLPA